jgi:hypothetical protein
VTAALIGSGLVIGVATIRQNADKVYQTGVSPLARLVNNTSSDYHMQASVNPLNQWVEIVNSGAKDKLSR